MTNDTMAKPQQSGVTVVENVKPINIMKEEKKTNRCSTHPTIFYKFDIGYA